MPWSGGTYTKGNQATGGWAGDQANGIGIESGRHDNQDNDFTTGINSCLNKSGQNTPTANLPMGGFKHTNVAVASSRTDYARTSQVQDDGFIWCGTSGGSANAQTIDIPLAPSSLTTGTKVRFIAGFTNTGAITLKPNSFAGTPNLRTLRDGTVELGAKAVLAGGIYEAMWDGTQFRFMSDDEGIKTWTPSYSGNDLMTYTSVTTLIASYRRRGPVIQFYIYATGTVGGTPSSLLQASLPVEGDALTGNAIACAAADGGQFRAGWADRNLVTGTTSVRIGKGDGTNYTAGAGRAFIASGTYEAA